MFGYVKVSSECFTGNIGECNILAAFSDFDIVELILFKGNMRPEILQPLIQITTCAWRQFLENIALQALIRRHPPLPPSLLLAG